MKVSDDDLDRMVPSYEKWKHQADEIIKSFVTDDYTVLKVEISIRELEKWLRENELLNIQENREDYVDLKVKEFMENKAARL